MGKLRHGIFPTEGTVEHDVQRSTGQPLLAANDMGNLHQVVVDDICQVICRQLVGTLIQHLVVADITLDTYFATDEVVDENLLTGLDLKTNDILVARSNQLLDFLLGEGQRVTHLTARMAVVLEVLNLSTLGLQLLWGVESDICLVGIQQLLNIFLIDIATLTLTVGTFVATKRHALVELDTQPLERLDDVLFCSRHETCGVGVFDAEHKVAAMLACKQVIIECGTYAADV